MYPFQTDFLYLVVCIHVSSISFHALIAHLFLALNIILLSRFTTVNLSIHLLKYISVAPNLAIMNKTDINICVQVFV